MNLRVILERNFRNGSFFRDMKGQPGFIQKRSQRKETDMMDFNDEYRDIENRQEVRNKARMFRRKMIRYKEAEYIYSMHAAKLAGLRTVPAVIKKLNDDEAVIYMVDANVQREEILPSERAFSFKMKLEALTRQGQRTDLTSGNNFPKLQDAEEKRSRNQLGKDAGMSGRSVQNYIKLTELIPEMLELVDQKKIGITMAINIASFDEELQKWLVEYYKDNGFLKPLQIEALKDSGNTRNITQSVMIQILNDALPDKKKGSGKLTFSERKLDKYFPPHFSSKEREMVIIGLLEKWHEGNK